MKACQMRTFLEMCLSPNIYWSCQKLIISEKARQQRVVIKKAIRALNLLKGGGDTLLSTTSILKFYVKSVFMKIGVYEFLVKKLIGNTQYGKSRIFLPLRFYMKSILVILKPQKNCHFDRHLSSFEL